jgi:hypothetical protein
MKEDELQAALDPVREYFSGRELSLNTVLAAHLRAHGLPASGRAWDAAKAIVAAGRSFSEAIGAARAAAAETAELQPLRSASPLKSSSSAANVTDRRTLDWFAKQFGPGDIDGIGARRLLGTPNNDPAWVLVRETGQNSWDARGTAPVIDFTLNLRRLASPVVRALRQRVLTGEAPGTGLPDLLDRDEIWALEVSDHGTVGLTGSSKLIGVEASAGSAGGCAACS